MFKKRSKQEESSEYISRRMGKQNGVAWLEKQEAWRKISIPMRVGLNGTHASNMGGAGEMLDEF